MLSGVGAKEELYEVGIRPRVDLPGVGKNLEDHLVRKSSLQKVEFIMLTALT